MYNKYRVLILTIVTAFVTESVAFAAIVIQVGDGTVKQVQANETDVEMSVFLYLENLTGPRTLTNFDLAFDFGVAGVGGFDPVVFNPANFEIVNRNAGLNTTNGFTNPDVDANNYDFLVSTADNTPGVDISTSTSGSPVHLFDIRFDILGGTPGVYNLAHRDDATQGGFMIPINSLSGSGVDITSGDPNIFLRAEGGQFEITAVPEPSSILALAGLCGVCCLRRSRRRKSVPTA